MQDVALKQISGLIETSKRKAAGGRGRKGPGWRGKSQELEAADGSRRVLSTIIFKACPPARTLAFPQDLAVSVDLLFLQVVSS